MHIKIRFRIAEILLEKKHINECFEFCNELEKYVYTKNQIIKLKNLKLKLNGIIANEIRKNNNKSQNSASLQNSFLKRSKQSN